ncbi:MAG: aminopeptidase, partial [Candidatus Doudnabacteria bacterium]
MPDYPKQLAELAVHVGAAMQPGQDLIVTAWDPIQAPLARAIAEEAYASGARYVSVVYWDGPVKASRLRHAPEDSLGFVPD